MEDDSGEYEDLYSVVNKRIQDNLSQDQVTKSKRKNYPPFRDNPLFLRLQPDIPSYRKSDTHKTERKMNYEKKGRKNSSEQRNHRNRKDIDQNHVNTLKIASTRRSVPSSEFQKPSMISKNKVENRPSSSQFYGEIADKNTSSRHISKEIRFSTLTLVHHSRNSLRHIDRLENQEISQRNSRLILKPRMGYKAGCSVRDLRQDGDTSSKITFGNEKTDLSQQDAILQNHRKFDCNKSFSQEASRDDGFEIGRVRRRMTVPCVECFNQPSNEIVTHSKSTMLGNKPVKPRLSAMDENISQTIQASHRIENATPMDTQRARVLARNQSEPNLTLRDKKHKSYSRRQRSGRRETEKCNQDDHDHHKSIRHRESRRTIPCRINSLRSLNENKRWKAYRTSHGSSNSICWSASRHYSKNMDNSSSRLAGD
jgi:hypothetical protein